MCAFIFNKEWWYKQFCRWKNHKLHNTWEDKFTARWRLKCHEGAGNVRFNVLSYSQRENVSSAYSPLRIVLTPPGANRSDSVAAWNSSGYARSAACAERTAVIVCVLRNCIYCVTRPKLEETKEEERQWQGERKGRRGRRKRILFYERNYNISFGDGNEPCEASPECNVSRAQLVSLSRDIKSNYVTAQLKQE